MINNESIIGKVYGHVTVLSAGEIHGKNRKYLCKCSCGHEFYAFRNNLIKGNTTRCKPCGLKTTSSKITRHGMSEHPMYNVYRSMINRCYDKKNSQYINYGQKGITVCDRWLASFDNFLEDMGVRPDCYSIDRIDNNGNYEKENCRWATNKQQCRNTSRNKLIVFNGETKCVVEWAEMFGLKASVIYKRLARGWDVSKSLEAPLCR